MSGLLLLPVRPKRTCRRPCRTAGLRDQGEVRGVLEPDYHQFDSSETQNLRFLPGVDAEANFGEVQRAAESATRPDTPGTGEKTPAGAIPAAIAVSRCAVRGVKGEPRKNDLR